MTKTENSAIEAFPKFSIFQRMYELIEMKILSDYLEIINLPSFTFDRISAICRNRYIENVHVTELQSFTLQNDISAKKKYNLVH